MLGVHQHGPLDAHRLSPHGRARAVLRSSRRLRARQSSRPAGRARRRACLRGGEAIAGRDYFRALHNYLLHYARDAYEEFEGEASVDLDAVDILTVHQAKGLEWPIVFLPSLVQGRFPSRRAGQPQDWLLPEAVFPADVRRRYEGGDAEERRLFYVALTRARDAVYLSAFERKTNRFQPSDYLRRSCRRDAADCQDRATAARTRRHESASHEPPTLDVSFSDLAAFDECGHRYRLSNVLGLPDADRAGAGLRARHPSRPAAGGRDGPRVGQLRRPPKSTALWHDEFFVPFASPQAWETMRQAARRLVTTYVGHVRDGPACASGQWSGPSRCTWTTASSAGVRT